MRVRQAETRYAKSGDINIAYQVVGEGPVDLVFVRGFSGDLLSTWDQPLLVRHLLGLAAARHRSEELDTVGDGFFAAVDGPRDLVAGSDHEFEDRGARELKGVPGTWRLYAVVPSPE